MSVDILMATYNGEKYLTEQIDSIRAQTYQDWTLLVSDDCSTDGTLNILRKYEQEDSRIKVVSEGMRYGGAKENFWSLLPRANAPYVMFCDQDDIWYPNKIERTLSEMTNLENRLGADMPLLVFTDSRLVNSAGRPLYDSFSTFIGASSFVPNTNLFLFRNIVPGCMMMMNRSLVDALTVLEDTSAFEIHDWWVALVASAVGEVYFLDAQTMDYRQHEGNARGLSGATPKRRIIPRLDNARRAAINSINRANYLLELYPDKMKEAEHEALLHYVNTRKGGIAGVIELRKSSLWRRTRRSQLGQIAVTLLGLANSGSDGTV